MAYGTSSGNYFTVARNYNGATALSASIWIYYSSQIETTLAGCWEDAGTVQQWLISKDSSDILTVAVFDGSYRVATGGSISRNTWQHIGFVYNSSAATVRSYINGAFSTSVAVGSGGSLTNRGSAASGIGARQAGNKPFAGNLAEFATWTAALTDAEMASLGDGFVPSNIRKPDIYIPFIRDKSDIANKYAITTIGSPTVENHPRVYI